jgi:site-specific DNA recombinase
MEVKKAVVAYCRVSTLEQKKKGHGIEIQVRDVTLFAQAQGLFIRRFFKDEAQSGVAEDRRDLRRLLRECQAGRVARLIIPSLDRLSRDVRLAENLFYQFEQLGVQVLIADMPTYNGKDRKDVLIRQIREAIAEENRKDIIERLWKGRQERVRRGGIPGGTVAYGYRREGRRLVVDVGEADVVRRVFELAERGLTAGQVARTLTEKALERRNGKPWTRRQVAALLARRPLYMEGRFQYGEAFGENKSLALLREVGNNQADSGGGGVTL